MIRFEHTFEGRDHVSMTISDDHAALSEVLEAFRKFCVVVGYSDEGFVLACKYLSEEEC